MSRSEDAVIRAEISLMSIVVVSEGIRMRPLIILINYQLDDAQL